MTLSERMSRSAQYAASRVLGTLCTCHFLFPCSLQMEGTCECTDSSVWTKVHVYSGKILCRFSTFLYFTSLWEKNAFVHYIPGSIQRFLPSAS